jgi:hypothetical protein
MYRTVELVAAATLLVACANERLGMEAYPIGSVDSDGAILRAVKHALPSDERACPLEILTTEDSWQAGERSNTEVVSANICGRRHAFSIQRRPANADSILIVAKKLD